MQDSYQNSQQFSFRQRPYSLKRWPCSSKQWLYFAVFFSIGYTHTAVALEQDQNAPIEIEANRATVDELKQMAVYEGKVALSQGTLRLSASQLTVWSKDNKVERLEAKGEPATYTQTFEDNPNPIYAEAKVIYYFPHNGKITLEKNARVVQGQHRFEGDHIEYDIQQQKLSAKGETNPLGEKMSRVKVVIPPQPSTLSNPPSKREQ